MIGLDAFRSSLLGAGIVTLLAAGTVICLVGPLRRLLVDLCRSENHGRFWVAFTGLSIVLTSLFGSLFRASTADLRLWEGARHEHLVVSAVCAGLFGLLLCLALVALGLLVSVGQRGSTPPTTPARLASDAG